MQRVGRAPASVSIAASVQDAIRGPIGIIIFTARHWAYLAAFGFLTVTLGPTLAHLFELANKIALDRDAYFTVQTIYRGWALFGFAIAGALLSTLVLAILLRRERRPMLLAALAFLALAASQVIFWIWTYSANVATSNWTEIPSNWQTLRAQWEYSHAVGAVLTFMAMIALALSVLNWSATSKR